MTPPPSRDGRAPSGLDSLRRAGAVSDLLFLYECETRSVTGLRPLAARLGLTVQAASHTYRGLARRGLVELRGRRYRPTVKGVDWLHAALDGMREDLAGRLDRLQIVRTTPALATHRLRPGDAVGLSLRDGLLHASPGPSEGSRGTARTGASAGEIVEVGNLAGIVPLPYGTLRVATFPAGAVGDPGVRRGLRAELDGHPPKLLLTYGLEAHHLITKVGGPGARPVRFGVAGAALDATRLGVDCTVVVGDRDVPALGRELEDTDLPTIAFVPLGPGAPGRHGRAARGEPGRDLPQRRRRVRDRDRTGAP